MILKEPMNNTNNMSYHNLKDYVGSKILVLFSADILAAEALNMIGGSIPVSYICDNDKRKCGKYLMGVEIKSTQELEREDKDNLTVLITNNSKISKTSITLQLHRLGIYDIISHSDLMNYTQQKTMRQVNVVGKEFHINSDDKEARNKISLLFDLIEDDDFSKELLFSVIANRMEREYIDFDFIHSGRISYPIYFSHEIFGDINENEIIISGGLADTNDFLHFYRILGNRLKKAYGFEADKKLFKSIEEDLKNTQVLDYSEKTYKNINEMIDIKVYPFALSGKNDSTDNKSEILADSVCIDEIVDADDRITLIKLDIEGAELDTLKGASETILKYKPRLLVCLYHKPTDLWEIPIFIKNLCPGYKLYIRPHNGLKHVVELHAVYR